MAGSGLWFRLDVTVIQSSVSALNNVSWHSQDVILGSIRGVIRGQTTVDRPKNADGVLSRADAVVRTCGGD